MSYIKIDIDNQYISDKFSLKNIHFSIDKNSICVFIGNNGAGKTSLINLLIKNYKLNDSIYIDNKNLNKISYKDLSKYISYVPQINSIYNELTVWDFVSIGRLPQTNFLGFLTKKDKDIINDVLNDLKISEFKNNFISHLSGGQRQKVIIANALVQQTPIMIFDEPLNFFDLEAQDDIYKLIKKLKKANKTIIIVLHDIEIAANLADKIVIFYNGTTPCIGNPQNVITTENIKKYFNVDRKIYIQDQIIKVEK